MSLENRHLSVYLPAEILIHIFSYVQPHTDTCSFLLKTNAPLYTCSLVSRDWYTAAMPVLYRNPVLNGRNLDLFLSTVYPYRATTLGDKGNFGLCMIKELHLGVLTGFNSGSRILSTKRVLDRCKDRLEVFVAPRTCTRHINFCLAELSKCVNLKTLDLSFVVGHAVNLSFFLNIITKLTKLECLHAPGSHDRVFMSLAKQNFWQWPPKLRELHISGSWVHSLLTSFTPESLPCLTRLYILNWPQLSYDIQLLSIVLPLLEAVDIQERMEESSL